MVIIEENRLTIEPKIITSHAPPLMLGLVSEIMCNVECKKEEVIVKFQFEKKMILSRFISLLDGGLLTSLARHLCSSIHLLFASTIIM